MNSNFPLRNLGWTIASLIVVALLSWFTKPPHLSDDLGMVAAWCLVPGVRDTGQHSPDLHGRKGNASWLVAEGSYRHNGCGRSDSHRDWRCSILGFHGGIQSFVECLPKHLACSPDRCCASRVLLATYVYGIHHDTRFHLEYLLKRQRGSAQLNHKGGLRETWPPFYFKYR